MTKSSVMYFVLVRGFLQFGILAAAVYVLLNLLDGSSLSTVRWGIVIGFPVFGLLWGLLIWWYERSKGSKNG